MSRTDSSTSRRRASAVVAVDFGTTFSGFAYAKSITPDEIHKVYEWPCAGKAGAKPYCKTQTSLYYVPSIHRHGHFELKDWGWSGLLQFTQAARSLAKTSGAPENKSRALIADFAALYSGLSTPISNHPHKGYVDVLSVPEKLTERLGFFATKFKLYLADGGLDDGALPGDLTVERMVIDYLKDMSDFIMSQLQHSYGQHFSKQDVQWCLTVPAIWNERAKQVMKMCAEKSGMVNGAHCTVPDLASPYPLDIILEPEAASVYCQGKAKHVNLKKGDKMLVADIGGGTIDLVVHEKVDDDPDSMRVEEVVVSYGEMGGGTFVDNHFFHLLAERIGCFKEFCRENTTVGMNIYSWWQGIKMGFDGHGYTAELPLPRKLSDAWKRYDKEQGMLNKDDDFYDELRLEESDFMKIFDPEIDKVERLITKQIDKVRVLMLVGGFSESPYLRKRIYGTFERTVEVVITPENPGSAICHGAVQLHMGNQLIQSRIAKRTYGIACCFNAEPDDPPELIFVDDDGKRKCDNRFYVFVRAGERVACNSVVKRTIVPSEHGERETTFRLFSSPDSDPRYTTETGVVAEGRFRLDMSEGLDLDKERVMEVSMCFGAAAIQVSARRVNFGDRTEEKGPSVTFQTGA